MAVMALGMFLFELPTLLYDKLQRKMEWNHASSGRVGARDAVQYVGPGPETVNLSGTVYAEIADGLVQIDTVVEMAASGEAWPLIDGAGRAYGDFVIRSVDESQCYFALDGTPLRIDFTIDLLRVDDEPALEDPE